MSHTSAEDWHQDFYDDVFAEQCLKRSDEEVENTRNFLIAKLHLDKGDTLFDQGCGLGGISLPMARAGIRTISVDLIEHYIKRAQAEADKDNLPAEFYAGNAYEFTPNRPCDAAINWWTSFGYSEDDEKNKLMMHRIFESLKPGGYFGFEYKNGARVLEDFAQSNTLRDSFEKDGHHTVWESTFNPDTKMVFKNWFYTEPDGTRHENIGGGAKLYTYDDIKNMLQDVGFTNIDFYADVTGAAFDPETSIRCIAISQKPDGA